MARKKRNRAISNCPHNDVVNLFEYVVEVTANQFECGHWSPTLHLISLEEHDDNERGLVICLHLDMGFDTPEEALAHGLDAAEGMNAMVDDDDGVFQVFHWTEGEDEPLRAEYLRLFDDGSPLH